jgi:hypothetical protein
MSQKKFPHTSGSKVRLQDLLTVRSRNADDETLSGLEFFGEVDLVSWTAFHELDIWISLLEP